MSWWLYCTSHIQLKTNQDKLGYLLFPDTSQATILLLDSMTQIQFCKVILICQSFDFVYFVSRAVSNFRSQQNISNVTFFFLILKIYEQSIHDYVCCLQTTNVVPMNSNDVTGLELPNVVIAMSELLTCRAFKSKNYGC